MENIHAALGALEGQWRALSGNRQRAPNVCLRPFRKTLFQIPGSGFPRTNLLRRKIYYNPKERLPIQLKRLCKASFVNRVSETVNPCRRAWLS